VSEASTITRTETGIGDRNLRFALFVAVLVGAVIRFLPLGASPYALNDGALFAHMANDLARNGFLLPEFTTYNGENIPFAYPPLGIYLTAIHELPVGNRSCQRSSMAAGCSFDDFDPRDVRDGGRVAAVTVARTRCRGRHSLSSLVRTNG